MSIGKIVGIGVAAVAAALAGVLGSQVVISAVTGSATADDRLDAPTPDGWSEIPVMEGGGAISIDAGWQDISTDIGADFLQDTARDQSGIDMVVDGVWLIDGDLINGGTSLFVWSVADAGGPSSARLEASTAVQAMREQFPDLAISAERSFTTASDHQGYLMEYTYSLYTEQIDETIGVIIVDSSQLLIQTGGFVSSGSGIDTLETVLNSFDTR